MLTNKTKTMIIDSLSLLTTKDKEFEIRFKKLRAGTFYDLLNRLMTYFKHKIEYSLIVTHQDDTRVTKYLEPNDSSEDIVYPWKNSSVIFEKIIKKHKIVNMDDTELGVRFSLSDEIPVKDSSCLFDDNNPPVFFKSRKRFTFIDTYVKFEVSMFKSSKNINNLENQQLEYDIEIEILSPNITVKNIEENVKMILEIIQKSNVIMTVPETNKILNVYKKLCNNSRFIGVQPLPLSDERYSADEEYVATLKLDGERVLLFFYEDKCFIVDKMMKIRDSGISFSQDTYNCSLVDAELLGNTLHCFDILFFKGKDIRESFFQERIDNLNIIIKAIDNPLFVLKKYFYENIYEILSETKCDSDIDGVILVKKNKGYNEAPLKWKPDNTIDFMVKKKNSDDPDYEIWELLTSNGNIFVFDCYDFPDIGTLKIHKNEGQNFKNNTVIEFGFNSETQMFYPIKHRFDKVKGNNENVAKDNFKLTLLPFDLRKTKRNFKLVQDFNKKRFENFVKRKILSTIPNIKGKLLVLGCNNGVDIQKWVDFNIKNVKVYDSNNISLETAKKINEKVKNKKISKNFVFDFEYKDLKIRNDDEDIYENIIHFDAEDVSSLQEFSKNMKSSSHLIITTKENVFLEKDFILLDNLKYKDYYADWRKFNNYLTTQEKEEMFSKNVYIFRKKNKVKC